MKCAVVTLHDNNYQILADLTWHKNRKLYAEHRGYDTFVKTENFGVPKIGFAKITLMLEALNTNKYDVLHWSGTDTIITNFTIPLTEFLYDGFHVTLATDFNGINADSIVIRNTPEAKAWLQMIMDKMPQYLNHPYCEQGIMMETYNDYRNIVKIVPQRYLNAYHYPLYRNKGARNNNDSLGFSGQWQKGDFLLHAPDQPMHIRLALFNEALQYLVK